MAVINKHTHNSAAKDAEKAEPSSTARGNAAGAATVESRVGFPQKIKNVSAI